MHITPGLIWIGWITVATLAFYIVLGFRVAAVRSRHRIPPPAMSGHVDLECALRVQGNTLELLVPFLAALWLCAIFWAPLPAAILGVVWLFARILYALGYYRAPARRMPGFILSMFALILLLIGTAYGLVRMGLIMGV